MSRLRPFLMRAVFLGIGTTQGGCCCGTEDLPELEAQVERGSPEQDALLDRCLANPDDCEPLCRAVLEAELPGETQYYTVLECEVTPGASGALVRVVFDDASACGRAPDALCAWSPPVADPVQRWLARAAYLEAASVTAFVRLAADLAHHGAPRALVAAALAAARDEIRHAARVRALVHSVPVPAPRLGPYRPATLRELALSNAVEGCARETLGAAENLWQARTAPEPRLRALFAELARDEVVHAELAWAVHAWVLDRLDVADRTAIRTAHRAALVRLSDEVLDEPAARELGLPDRDGRRALVAAIARLAA